MPIYAKISIGLLLLFLLVTPAAAQLGISILPGKIAKHTPNLRYDIPSSSNGVSINFRFQERKGRYWVAYYGFPEVDLRVGYQDFNDPDVLGRAWYALPEITFFPLGKKGLVSPMFTIGTGLAYIDRQFDVVENPDNNSISSRINNATSIGLGLGIRLKERHQIRLRGRLTHFSNARFKAPNLGINVLAVEINYQYTWAGSKEWTAQMPKDGKHWFLELSGMYAVNEYPVPGGPKFPVHAAGISFGWPISAYQHLVLFPFWQYSSVEPSFDKSVFTYEDNAAAERAGNHFGAALGLESRFHRLAVSLFWGYEVSALKDHASPRVFNLIRLQYLVPLGGRLELAPGVQFKSKEITAEYIGLLLAVRFRKNKP